MQIELQTSDGVLITRQQMPKFQRLPAVVTWGNRTFSLYGPAQPEFTGDRQIVFPVYREVFAYAIPVCEWSNPQGFTGAQ